MKIEKTTENFGSSLKCLTQIHRSADPLSVWAQLDETTMSKLLYAPALNFRDHSLTFIVKGNDRVGFILVVFLQHDGPQMTAEKMQIIEKIHMFISLIRKPRLVTRAVFVQSFELWAKRFQTGSYFNIHSLMVKSDYQNFGLGSALLESVKREIRLAGSPSSTVFVTTFGAQAKKFYQKNGFIVKARWKVLSLEISLLSLDVFSEV